MKKEERKGDDSVDVAVFKVPAHPSVEPTTPSFGREKDVVAAAAPSRKRNKPSLRISLKRVKRHNEVGHVRVPTPYPSPTVAKSRAGSPSSAFGTLLTRIADEVFQLTQETMQHLVDPKRSLTDQLNHTKARGDRILNDLVAMSDLHVGKPAAVGKEAKSRSTTSTSGA